METGIYGETRFNFILFVTDTDNAAGLFTASMKITLKVNIRPIDSKMENNIMYLCG